MNKFNNGHAWALVNKMKCSMKTNAFEVQCIKLLKTISIVMRPNQFH